MYIGSPVEHNYKSIDERNAVLDFIDDKIGVEYDVTDDGDRSGSIVVFDLEKSEFDALMAFLMDKNFIERKRSEDA